ncbi:MAG: PAS domain S-box protein [Chitinispirillaceae bacterium]|nr:PAS domain S-box protein [Chitinispirillaceae bacterium]
MNKKTGNKLPGRKMNRADTFTVSTTAALSILENATEGILVVDVETRVIHHANPAICTMFGYSPDELYGSVLDDLHPAEHLQNVLEQFEAIARGEQQLVAEIPCRRKNGTIFPADVSASRISINGMAYITGFFTDVTIRKQSEEILQQSEKQFKTLFMAMSDAFYLSEILFDDTGDPCDYRYLEVNPKFEEIAGLRRDQIIGRRYRELVPVDTSRWLEIYCTVARTGKPMSYDFYSAEYNKYFETYSYQPAKGQISVIVRDVTKRKRMEEALQNTQKLESLGIMAGGIAHDFNNLLTGIFGNIDLACSVCDDSKTLGYLDATLRTMNRATSLTRQLLTFAKGGAPVRNATQVAPLLQESANFALSGSNLAGQFSFANDLKPCNIDKHQIAQVIENIIINAQQAMPDGGIVEISAMNSTFEENEHPPLVKGEYVKVVIRDHGIGIPKEILPRIFDPFYTTKIKGHGLGLATCHSIIKRHGGCLEAESEPGKGSVFYFFLPVSSGVVASNERSGSSHCGSGTIIIMDDEDVVRNTFRQMLESFGYSVSGKKDGKEALDCFAEQTRAKKRCVAMFFDLTVPGGMGGIEAVREVRKTDADIPVFVVSGYSEDPVMKNPAEYGFTAGITKPFIMEEVADLLNRYIK